MKKKTQEKEDGNMTRQEKETDNKENTTGQETGSSVEANNKPTTENSEEASTSDTFVAEVRAVEEKLADMQDKYLRLSAEFDNYRKRTLREKMDLSKYAEESILAKIIPFMDDFERALGHIEASDQNMDALKSGVNLIYTKFSEFLRQNGIKEIEALGSPFDVDLHEAVAKVQVDDPEKKGKVVDVALKGYYLRDKVLRFAKVVVGE